MKNIVGLMAIAMLLASVGCSKNKELIAQKDAEIASLQSEKARLEAEIAEQRRMTDDLNARLAGLQEEKRVLVEERDNLTHITLDGSATFGTAQADLTAEGQEALDQVWSVLQNYPDRRVLIEGHTDDRPIRSTFQWKYKSNWELSSARAHSVLHYIQNKYSVEPQRLAAVGYGENMPVADNGTTEGRATNRRVVITVGSKVAIAERQNEYQSISLDTSAPEGQ